MAGFGAFQEIRLQKSCQGMLWPCPWPYFDLYPVISKPIIPGLWAQPGNVHTLCQKLALLALFLCLGADFFV